jgi:hypothetical protein
MQMAAPSFELEAEPVLYVCINMWVYGFLHRFLFAKGLGFFKGCWD